VYWPISRPSAAEKAARCIPIGYTAEVQECGELGRVIPWGRNPVGYLFSGTIECIFVCGVASVVRRHAPRIPG
jgi:hypothetical protein